MQKTVVIMEDDLDGSVATQTIRFSVDGADLEIDLSDENADAFRSAVQPYVGAARRVGGRAKAGTTASGRGRKAATRQGPVDNAAVRAWAASNGVDVNARGRIPASVTQQYREAGN